MLFDIGGTGEEGAEGCIHSESSHMSAGSRVVYSPANYEYELWI